MRLLCLTDVQVIGCWRFTVTDKPRNEIGKAEQENRLQMVCGVVLTRLDLLGRAWMFEDHLTTLSRLIEEQQVEPSAVIREVNAMTLKLEELMK